MFDNIIGHEKFKRIFGNMKSDQLSNSYLIVGAPNIGKYTFAMEVSKKFSGIDRNITIINPEKGNISIDIIREMQEQILQPPFGSGNRRMVVINEADCLNDVSANALLKLLEEPPVYCTFILVSTDIKCLPDTIVSRCSILRFYPLTDEVISTVMKDVDGIKPDYADFIRVCVNGRVGILLSMQEDGSLIKTYEKLYKLQKKLLKSSKLTSIVELSEMFSQDDSILQELNIIRYYTTTQLYQVLLEKNRKADSNLSAIIKAIVNAHDQIVRGANVPLVLDDMLMNIFAINRRE